MHLSISPRFPLTSATRHSRIGGNDGKNAFSLVEPSLLPPHPSSSGVSRGSLRKGFSLVELSIVLVILGLLTGGILAGQSLIRAAELRAIPTEYQRYLTATQTFRDKYMALPGDMNNATRFWLRMANSTDCPTNSAAALTATGTCDGNGNGVLTIPASASTSGETFHFWRQLALAGMIEGTYSGTAGPNSNTHALVGTNIPASRISNAGWNARTLSGIYSADPAIYALEYGAHFQVGAQLAASSANGAILTPAEAWNMDSKFDDGVPSTGKVIGTNILNNCGMFNSGTAVNTNLDASYNITNNAILCALIFRQLF